MNILIVDDIKENQYLLEKILSSKGYVIKTAGDGTEALQILKKDPIGLIISDILMPKMDGFKFCRECKKDEKLKNIPFFFYTATYTEKKDEEFALSLGAEKFIIKPQEPDVFLKILKDFFKEYGEKAIIGSKKETDDEVSYLTKYSKRVIVKLEKKVMDLNREIALRKRVENNLKKGLKELNCLYCITDLIIKQNVPLEQIFEEILNILSISWQYPEITCSRIVFDKQEFKTDNFEKTKWKQVEVIKLRGKKVGVIEIYYLEKKPEISKGLFLKEEKNLIKSISKILTTFIERKYTEEEQKESYFKLEKTLNSAINALASIVEYKDPYTSGHHKRVKALVLAISKELGLDEDRMKAIGTAAIVHDIGKINIPASILSKPGKISNIEFDMIKTHCQIGYNILKEIEFTYPIAKIVLQHHEKLNSSGYPQGLSDKGILLEAKILSVADVVEAMSSHRPYREALGIDKALEEIVTNKNILYDAKVVDACLNVFRNGKFKF
jgi:putative nucleotidyltransferase with HDIG domain